MVCIVHEGNVYSVKPKRSLIKRDARGIIEKRPLLRARLQHIAHISLTAREDYSEKRAHGVIEKKRLPTHKKYMHQSLLQQPYRLAQA